MTKEDLINFLISYAVDRMSEYLVQDYNMPLQEALDLIYNSQTYRNLTNSESGLYKESPSYHYYNLIKECNLPMPKDMVRG